MTAVGLELGGNAIKVAVVEGTRGGAKLKAFEARKIDAKKGETEDDIISVINEVLKQAKAPRNAVVCSVRAQDCMIREIVVPFVEDDKIRKTVKYQAENYFTSLSIDDLIIEYSKFAEVETKSKLLVAGIKKSHVGRRLELLGECGVDPVSIDLDVAALYNTYAHMGVFDDVGGALIVEIKADTLKVGVVEEGRLRLARAIRMRLGQMQLDAEPRPKRIAAESGIYETAADDSARLPVVILDEGDDEAFSLEDSGITETERESILHRVFMEIDRTVASVQLQREIELICLTGPSCKLEGIEQVFSDHFEIEARRIDIASHFGQAADLKGKIKGPSISLDGGTAVGLALKGLGIDHAGMDFRQEEFGYRGTFAQLRKGLACAMTLLFALTFLYAFNLKQELRQKRNALDGVKTMQKNLYTVLFPNLEDPNQQHLPLTPPTSTAYAHALKKKRGELQSLYAGDVGTDQPKVRTLEILRQFALAKSKVSRQYGLQVLQISVESRKGGQSRFVCHCTDRAGPIELQKYFEGAHPELEGFNRETRDDKKRGGFRFEFVIKIKDPGRT